MKTYTRLSDMNYAYDSTDITVYDGLALTGTEVASVIRQLQRNYPVTVNNGTTVIEYNLSNRFVDNVEGNTYIDPNAYYVAQVTYNANGAPIAMSLTEDSMIIEDSSSSSDNSKTIIAEAVKNGATDAMTWTEIANTITNVLADYSSNSVIVEQAIVSLETSINDIRDQIKQAENQTTSWNDTSAKELVATALGETSSEFESWEVAAEKVSDLVELNKNLKIQLEALMSNVEQTVNQSDLELLRTQIEQIRASIYEKTSLIEELNNQLSSTTESSVEEDKTLEQLKADITTNIALIDELTTEVENLTKQLENLNKSISDYALSRDQWIAKWNQAHADYLKYYDLYNSVYSNWLNNTNRIAAIKQSLQNFIVDTYNASDSLDQTLIKVQNGKNAIVTAIGNNALYTDSLDTLANKLIQYKQQIKAAIEAKGGTVADLNYATLANAIKAISGGGSGDIKVAEGTAYLNTTKRMNLVTKEDAKFNSEGTGMYFTERQYPINTTGIRYIEVNNLGFTPDIIYVYRTYQEWPRYNGPAVSIKRVKGGNGYLGRFHSTNKNESYYSTYVFDPMQVFEGKPLVYNGGFKLPVHWGDDTTDQYGNDLSGKAVNWIAIKLGSILD